MIGMTAKLTRHPLCCQLQIPNLNTGHHGEIHGTEQTARR